MNKKILLKITGGIGDTLLALPAIRQLSTTYDVDLLLRDGSRSDYGEVIDIICKYNPYVNEMISFEDYVIYKKLFKKYDRVGLVLAYYLDQEITLKHDRSRYHYVGEQLGVSNCKHTDIDLFLQPYEIDYAKNILKNYKKTIIISPIKLRHNEWLNEGKTLNKSIWEKVITNFPDYTFIQLGLSLDSIELDHLPNVVNMVDKTTIRESGALLHVADYYILLDSFLNHIAGGMEKKGVTIWGSTSPNVYGYKSSVNLWCHPGCSPCRIQDPNYLFNQEPCCIRYTGIPIDAEEIIQVVSEEL